MPQKIICSSCGYILYEGEDFVYPGDIIEEYEGRCPKCRAQLSFSIEGSRLEVKPNR